MPPIGNDAVKEARDRVAQTAMRLTKGICLKYGHSKGCPRCRFYQTGRQALSKKVHTTECRKHKYDAMREAGDLRLRETNAEPARSDVPQAGPGDPFNEEVVDDHPDHLDDVDCPPTEVVDLQSDDDFLTGNFLDGDEPMAVDVDMVTDILMTCGVEVVDARRKAMEITRENSGNVIAGAFRECPTFIEAYGRGPLWNRPMSIAGTSM